MHIKTNEKPPRSAAYVDENGQTNVISDPVLQLGTRHAQIPDDQRRIVDRLGDCQDCEDLLGHTHRFV